MNPVDDLCNALDEITNYLNHDGDEESCTDEVLEVLADPAHRVAVLIVMFGADNVREGVLLEPLPSRKPHVGMPWIVYHPDYCSSDNFTKDVLIIDLPTPTGDAS